MTIVDVEKCSEVSVLSDESGVGPVSVIYDSETCGVGESSGDE